ncbi:MAG: hypothetical protein IKL55_01790 [Clostridia bacterium]|nr:hypothetical protein [Clostridia bacterium]
MKLVYIAIVWFAISIMLWIIGVFTKKTMLKKIGSTLIIVLAVLIIMFFFYSIYEMEEEEIRHFGTSANNPYVSVPDRIIYKTGENYYVIEPGDDAFDTIYKEIDKRIISDSYPGKVLSVDELKKLKDEQKFLEFDYYTSSKNRIFFLEEEYMGMIKMFEEDGQIAVRELPERDKLILKLEDLVKNLKSFEMREESYNSKNTITGLPEGFEASNKTDGIYHIIIRDLECFQKFLTATGFDPKEPNYRKIDFENNNAIVTICNADIENIVCNIGNIKYTYGGTRKLSGEMNVNILIVSKVINEKCIYDNVNLVRNEMPEIDYSLKTYYGIARGISDKQIEIGYSDTYLIAEAEINDETKIVDYNGNKLTTKGIRPDDCIVVTGNIVENRNDLERVVAKEIKVYPNFVIKTHIMERDEITNTIDGQGLQYIDVNDDGYGTVICGIWYNDFVYPVELKVTPKTETYLGFDRHLESNYGYILHEMCWITLDKNIKDLDNIDGTVTKIEYIAD